MPYKHKVKDKMRVFDIYFDGACEPRNPSGHMGYGYVVKENNALVFNNSYYEEARPSNTNNVAEYKACLFALQEMKKYLENNNVEKYKVNVFGDSKLVIEQLNRRWGINGGAYAEFAFQTQDFVKDNFSRKISFEWIPRAKNTEADEMSVRELKNRGVHRTK